MLWEVRLRSAMFRKSFGPQTPPCVCRRRRGSNTQKHKKHGRGTFSATAAMLRSFDSETIPESYKESPQTYFLLCTGNSTVMVVPSPSRLSSFSWAPCSRAMCFTMASPRPVPPVALLRLLSTR